MGNEIVCIKDVQAIRYEGGQYLRRKKDLRLSERGQKIVPNAFCTSLGGLTALSPVARPVGRTSQSNKGLEKQSAERSALPRARPRKNIVGGWCAETLPEQGP